MARARVAPTPKARKATSLRKPAPRIVQRSPGKFSSPSVKTAKKTVKAGPGPYIPSRRR